MANSKQFRHVVLIHGAWSTSTGFNYIKEHLEANKWVSGITTVNYDARYSTMNEIIANVEEILDSLDTPTVIVGHSLGGVIALAVANHTKVVGVLTLAAPVGGIEINKWFRRMFDFFAATRSPILADICSDSDFMTWLYHELEMINFEVNHGRSDKKLDLTMLIATQGYNPSIMEPSDGVLTILCQEDNIPQWAETIRVPVNHSEILQSPVSLQALEKLLS